MSSIVVNGRPQEVDLSAERSLLEVLREDLGLTGAKPACGEGACAACTVLLDGESVRACMTPSDALEGRAVTTVEGLAEGELLHPLQEAFIAAGAIQCGYCTPGMLLAAKALLDRTPDPSDAEIRSALAGNICRCCAYTHIERAIKDAGARMRLAAKTSAGADSGPKTSVVSGVDGSAGKALGEPAGGVPQPACFWDFRPKVPWDRTSPADREYFELLGDGLVVALIRHAASTDAPSRGARPAPGFREGVEAWLHVGANGRATAFTGKMDMGQDNRTALAMLVAEELRMEPESVSLAMSDTDLCPFDIGTYGSRSLPDAGEALRAAAASAREVLLELAAAQLGIEPGSESGRPEIDAGVVREARAASNRERLGEEGHTGERSIGYGDLVRGLRQVEITATPAPLTEPARWRYGGHPARRSTARSLVSGSHRFPSDLALDGMLHGLILRPPSYGAVLQDVDLSAAQALSGVTAVHEGDFVAVAAHDRRTAERALAQVHAHWSAPEQPAEQDIVAHLRSHPAEVLGWQGAVEHAEGDVERALDAAEVRVEGTYTTSYIAHAALETRVALARWEGERLTVFTGTQQPFFVRYELAAALGLHEEQVRVIVPDTGGAFGGKHTEAEAIAAARLARAAGRPVRVALSREEEFRYTYLRPAAVIDVHSGADRSGQMTAWDFTNVNAGSAGLSSPYRAAAHRVRFQPAISPLPQGPYRTLAATDNHFARESHVDELAHALGVDPLQLRLRNLDDERLCDVLRAAADRMHWSDRTDSQEEGVGLGIACGLEKEGRLATCAQVRISERDEVELLRIVTAYDCGAIVNPATVECQVEGALLMGLGGALFEAIHFASGRLLNASFHSYRVPRFSDVPPIEVILIDRPEVPSAGAGETPIVAIAPALANAIFAASGARIRSLPLLNEGSLAR